MAITLDTIVNKVFKVVKNGYDNNEVEQSVEAKMLAKAGQIKA